MPFRVQSFCQKYTTLSQSPLKKLTAIIVIVSTGIEKLNKKSVRSVHQGQMLFKTFIDQLSDHHNNFNSGSNLSGVVTLISTHSKY